MRLAGLLGAAFIVAALYSLLVGGLIDGILDGLRADLDLSLLVSLDEPDVLSSFAGPKISSL